MSINIDHPAALAIRNRLRRLTLVSIAVLVMALLTACGPDAPDIDVAALSTSAVKTVYASLTETELARPTNTPAPTDTPQPTLTPYWTATPGPDFAGARLLSASVDAYGLTLVMLEIPGLSYDATTVFSGTVSGVPYLCTRVADYPDTLFCSGPIRGPYITDDFLLFAGEGKEPVFKVSFFVYPTATLALPRFLASTTCEVEPLYQPQHPELTQFQDPSKAGCYAITCYADGSKLSYKCGTENTCLYWPTNPCP